MRSQPREYTTAPRGAILISYGKTIYRSGKYENNPLTKNKKTPRKKTRDARQEGDKEGKEIITLMALPSREQAQTLLEKHVKDEYQRCHARMVALAMEGYAKLFNEDADLWYITGLLHDIDFEEHPDAHPAPSLKWFAEWGYPQDLIHAVEAHAHGYNGFVTLPETRLAAALLACDEISGIFYAYQKINPIPYNQMKVSSLKKRLNEKSFAAKINRDTIYLGCEKLGVDIDAHLTNLISFFSIL